MNDPPAYPDARVAPERRAQRRAMLSLVLEFTLVFAGTLLAKHLLAATTTASYPNLLWFPVVVLALAHGLTAGIAAAIIAAAVQYSGGLPPALMSEDVYAYIGRITAEPVGWTCAALLIGHFRSRQIASSIELAAQLAESRRRCAALAELCDESRQRAEILERQIAANAYASNADLAEAMSGLQQANWEEFPHRLARYIVLMTACTEFAVHLLRDNALNLAFQSGDAHGAAADASIAAEDALFAAVVNERRMVLGRGSLDNAVLAGRAIMAGPLVEGRAPQQVIGMFSVGGASVSDCPQDMERRFVLTCTELSRLAGRIRLIERWHSAGAAPSNGHRQGYEHGHEHGHGQGHGPLKIPDPAHRRELKQPYAREQGKHAVTLQ